MTTDVRSSQTCALAAHKKGACVAVVAAKSVFLPTHPKGLVSTVIDTPGAELVRPALL